jgi:C-terminal processing protease CtpA/Prc
MRWVLLVGIVLLPGCMTSSAGSPASPTVAIDPAAYLSEALDYIEHNALYADRVDWPAARAAALERVEGATTTSDTYVAIERVLRELGDRHSHFVRPADAARLAQDDPAAPLPEGRRIAAVGYIALPPTIAGGDTPERYAETAVALIQQTDREPVCGWVVDLRENQGGNMWPMLAGIEPILGEVEVGAFIDAEGNRQAWSLRDGQAILGADVAVGAGDYDLKQPDPPVAVLTSRLTASSGEAVVVAFRGRPRTRSFGEATIGVPTVNTVKPMPDEALIVLTVARMADRTGQTYDSPIPPDQPVERTRAMHPPEQDNALQAALAWLHTDFGCATAAE